MFVLTSSFIKPTLTYGHKKSADLPYIRSGLVQPLISYGEVCAYAHTPIDIRFAHKSPSRYQFDRIIEQISLGKGTLASVPLANIQLITDMASKRAKIFAEMLQNIFNTASKTFYGVKE